MMPIHYPAYAPVSIPRELGISTLDLLKIPFLFTQSDLLTVTQFISEANKRGIKLCEIEMEQLYLQGYLVPFYQDMDISDEPKIYNIPKHTGIALYIAIAHGHNQIYDPGKKDLRSWPDENTGVLYSRYQLIALRFLRKILAEAIYDLDGNKRVCDLPLLDEDEQEALDKFRSLAIVLEVLSPRYRNRVMWNHIIPKNMENEYYNFLQNKNLAIESELLSLDPEILIEQANKLLVNAHNFDPLGKYHRVIKISSPSQWKELRYDALLAHEQRVAAEMILLFLEDEALHGRSQELRTLSPLQADWEPQRDRLKIGDQRERSEIIRTFGLSDRPSLYFAVEGETEFTIINMIHEEKGYDKNTFFVRFFDLKGDKKDLNLLAHAVAAPFLDADVIDGDIRLLSYPTVLFVVLDPNPKSSVCDKREKIIDYVMKSLPSNFRTSRFKEGLQNLIYVEQWKAEFEFAHFNDVEITEALSNLYIPDSITKEELICKVKECRIGKKNIKTIWKNWDKRVNKIELIKELWQFVESDIRNPNRERCIPILDEYDRAIEIAYETRKSTVISI